MLKRCLGKEEIEKENEEKWVNGGGLRKLGGQLKGNKECFLIWRRKNRD